jgi:uncharacterized membrane protein YkvA (DUF1232 family)
VNKLGRWARLLALGRFLRSRRSGFSLKLLVVAAALYLLLPADLVPDILPLAGWLDDLGVLALAFGWLDRAWRRAQGRDGDGAAPTVVTES